ncbi:hypothetical protein EDC94DRAFT_608049 [Helicostylum pulchrum]|nr:hypothetical protein EDC94DRAFT_608049 [Helicostylum pulchrum]
MAKAGIDENYKFYATRPAASTKTIVQGVPIRKVRDHTNCSLNSNTFEKYYYHQSECIVVL